MTTNDALTDTTRAMIEATARRLADAGMIASPRDLGITPDTRRNRMRAPRLRPARRKIIR